MLEAGTRLFAEREYDAVSMEEIAAAADVSKPMVYSYFESKQGLFLACVENATHRLMSRVRDATPDELPPDARMWHGMLAVFSFIEEHPDDWALLSPHGPAAGGQLAAGAASIRREFTAFLARLLHDTAVAEGIDPKVAREATEPFAHAIAAAVQGVAAWWKRESSDPADQEALRMMNFVWMGLENLMRGRLWLPPPGEPTR
jgi:AcrR family transcriptional regulator